MDELVRDFLSSSENWVCEGYSVNACYLIMRSVNGIWRVLRFSLVVGPLPLNEDSVFRIDGPFIKAGQIIKNNASKSEISEIFENAVNGKFIIDNESFPLESNQYYFRSELHDASRWECDLHLKINAPMSFVDPYFGFSEVEHYLRTANPPFDGITDLTRWLGFDDVSPSSLLPTAEIRVKPPVDCILHRTSLLGDELSISLIAHPKVNLEALHVAVRATPGIFPTGRKQISSEVCWTLEEGNSTMEGSVKIKLENSDSALLMISLGGKTVRRQWFLDPVKSRNSRAFATKIFDGDFKQAKRALFDDHKDSSRFEVAVSSLLYMLGCASAVQLETDSPDIIASTPAGRMLLIECTMRVSDFHAKLGKLVDRRNSLEKVMANNGHYVKLHSLLVCRVPRDQINFDETELKRHKVLLVSLENLENIFNRIQIPNDPDIFFSGIEQMESTGRS
jgi:hypothetical protein